MKQLRSLSYLLAAVLMGAVVTQGCESNETLQPRLSDSTVVAVLSELHLAGARQGIQGDVPRSIRDSILRRYDTDSTEFQTTITYYSDHPKEYIQIYDRVLDRLHQQRDDDPSQNPTARDTSDKP